jgi:hypothetical protein
VTAPTNIVDLQQLLRERLPRARLGFAPAAPRAALSTGVPTLDHVLEGGLPVGETAELTGNGTAEVLHALLRQASADGRLVALVDGADSFDADAAEPAELARLLWLRCRTVAEAVGATDLLLRDRNFPLVVLDLKLNPAAQLRRLSGSVWHRFGRLRAQHRTTLLVFTAQPLVNGATVRVQLRREAALKCLEQSAAERLARLQFTVLRQQLAGGEEPLARSA